MLKVSEKKFHDLDTNADGSIDLDEFITFYMVAHHWTSATCV